MKLFKIIIILLNIFFNFSYLQAADAIDHIIGRFLLGEPLHPSEKNISDMTAAELGQSKGTCYYNFVDYISYRSELECAASDKSILHLLPRNRQLHIRKTTPKIKCLPWQPTNANETGGNTLLVAQNSQEIADAIKQYGNHTKSTLPGRCALLFFYTETSYPCARIAAHVNTLPARFPTLRIVAVNAYKFITYTTEFGVVGLPTGLLIHQGRPVLRLFNVEGEYASSLGKRTNLPMVELSEAQVTELSQGPLRTTQLKQTDYLLILAWAFVALFCSYLFSKSKLFKQIAEMIERNWRESEAQLEQNAT